MASENGHPLLAGKYRLLESLGGGGTGEVYRALQLPLERLVAIKLLHPSLGRDPAVRRRFAREARAVAALNHPTITTIYDFGLAEDDLLYLAMEYIDGESLRALIDVGLPTLPTLLAAEQLLSGLAHAHARGLIHRDLKPGNVLVSRLDDQLRIKIVDFGIASAAGAVDEEDAAAASKGRVIGTPRYMSPEQAQGERNLTPATDLYNVGLMLYELAAGRHPFTAKTPHGMMLEHCTAAVPRPLPRPGFLLPDALERVILRLLAKDPADRYPSAAEPRAALAEIRASLEDRGHAIYLPVAPVGRGEAEGRITLVEGTARVVSGQPARMVHGLEVPLVGRQEERAFLLQLSQRVAQSGVGAMVFLEGEAGVGKTRLATWFKEEVVESGAMRGLAGRFLREGEKGLRGLREIVEQLFATRGLATPQASAKVASQLVTWSLTDARDAGLIIEMIRPPERDEAPRAIESAQEPLFAAVCRTLEAAARLQPLLLILDDLHWAGPQTADFLQYLATEMRVLRLPLLLLATLRSEDLPANPPLATAVSALAVSSDHVLRRRLGRLADDEIALLIRHVLPTHDSLTQTLQRRAEGNPLYALQILRHLVDEDLIVPDPAGTYVAAEGVRVEETVPPNLADLLQLRLVNLERRYGPERPIIGVLERAAVLGSRFPYDALATMVANESLVAPAELERLVDLLVDEGLLTPGQDPAEDLLDFTHNLVRDVLLKRMAPRRATRRLHLLAAEAKQAHFKGREEVAAAQLAAHYELGGDVEQAVRFAYLAARTAERMHAPASAITAWQRFLRLEPRLDPPARAELALPSQADALVHLGTLQESQGLYAEAEQSFHQLVPDIGEPLATVLNVRAAIGMATIALKQGRALPAEQLFGRALTEAVRLGHRPSQATATLGLARVAWHHGRVTEATEQGRRALEESKAASNTAEQADALWFLGDVARLTGDPVVGEMHFSDALSLYHALDEPRGVARCLYGLALAARAQNELDRAESLYKQAYDTLKPLGVRRGVAHCLNGLGEVARFRNRLSEAREYYQRAVELYQAAALPNDAAVSLTNLGLVARDAGDLETARADMEQALRVAESSDYRYLTLGIAFNLAWVYALVGERALCQKLLDEHLDKALKYGLVDPDFARPLEGIAELLDAAGETRTARRLYEHAQQMWEELRRDRDASRVAALLR